MYTLRYQWFKVIKSIFKASDVDASPLKTQRTVIFLQTLHTIKFFCSEAKLRLRKISSLFGDSINALNTFAYFDRFDGGIKINKIIILNIL